jgi:hypothetical protein
VNFRPYTGLQHGWKHRVEVRAALQFRVIRRKSRDRGQHPLKGRHPNEACLSSHVGVDDVLRHLPAHLAGYSAAAVGKSQRVRKSRRTRRRCCGRKIHMDPCGRCVHIPRWSHRLRRAPRRRHWLRCRIYWSDGLRTRGQSGAFVGYIHYRSRRRSRRRGRRSCLWSFTIAPRVPSPSRR